MKLQGKRLKKLTERSIIELLVEYLLMWEPIRNIVTMPLEAVASFSWFLEEPADIKARTSAFNAPLKMSMQVTQSPHQRD